MKESQGDTTIAIRSRSEEGNYYRWVEPNSEITVCLKTETVDRLQMEALRGIASSSREGTEVGGILLGRFDIDKSSILIFVDDFVLFPCEHRNGPFFDLSAAEVAEFDATLARGRTQWDQSVVGYYRSHNRDGLFLAPGDLQLIQRDFPAPHNIFLIIKTLPNHACTAGFFFWKDGRIQSEFTDSEAPLIPISFPPTSSAVQIPAPPEVVVQAQNDRAVAPTTEFTRRRTPRRHLIRGIAIAAVEAAALVAVIRYRAPQPVLRSQPVLSKPAPEIPLVAKDATPPPGMPEPVSTVKPLEPSSDPPKGEPATALPTRPERPSPFPRPRASNPLRATKPFVMPLPLTSNTASRTLSPTLPAPPAIAPSVPDAHPPLLFDETMCCSATASYEATRPNPVKRLIHEVPGLRKLNPSFAEGKGFVPPRPLHDIQISLPPDTSTVLQKKRIDLKASVDASGRVTRVELLFPRGKYLAQLAAYNATQWRFAPAELNDHPVSSEIILHFRFDTDSPHKQ